MTKVTYAAALAQTDDATFRAWGLQLSTALAAAGLVQTSDTGQVNWTTVTRPAAINTNAGYEIWRFNDTWQSAHPIFLRIDYGTSSNVLYPRMQFQLGAGSNGSGTITSVFGGTLGASPGTIFTRGTTPAVTPANTFVSHSTTNGSLVLAWAQGAVSGGAGYGVLVVERPRDDDGDVVDEGVFAGWIASNATPNGGCYVWATASGSNGIGCMHLNRLASTTVGSDIQVFRHYMSTPRVRNLLCLSYINAEITMQSTFTLTPFGDTAHTYLALGTFGGNPWSVNSIVGSQMMLAIPWED